MPKSIELLRPRGPRHLSKEGERAVVELRGRLQQAKPDQLGRPADISRTGMHLVVPAEAAEGATLFVTLRDANGQALMVREVRVQWTRQDDDAQWHIGVEFAAQLDWETLGELFLRNILDAGAAR